MGRDTFCIVRGSATEQKPKSSPARSVLAFHLPTLKGNLDVLSAHVETTKISQSNFPAKEEFVGCLAELWPRSDICKRMGQHAASGTTTSPRNEPSRSVTNDSEQLVAELLDEKARNGGAEAAYVLGVYGLAEEVSGGISSDKVPDPLSPSATKGRLM